MCGLLSAKPPEERILPSSVLHVLNSGLFVGHGVVYEAIGRLSHALEFVRSLAIAGPDAGRAKSTPALFAALRYSSGSPDFALTWQREQLSAGQLLDQGAACARPAVPPAPPRLAKAASCPACCQQFSATFAATAL